MAEFKTIIQWSLLIRSRPQFCAFIFHEMSKDRNKYTFNRKIRHLLPDHDLSRNTDGLVGPNAQTIVDSSLLKVTRFQIYLDYMQFMRRLAMEAEKTAREANSKTLRAEHIEQVMEVRI